MHRRGEAVLVPREVALAIGVLDVEPEHVERQVMLVELRVDSAHIVLVLVVPPRVRARARARARVQVRVPEPVLG